MSRSRKRTPFIAITNAESEKQDKIFAHRRYRRVLKNIISYSIIKQNKDIILPKERELSNIWCFSKDGKQYIFPENNPTYYKKSMRK